MLVTRTWTGDGTERRPVGVRVTGNPRDMSETKPLARGDRRLQRRRFCWLGVLKNGAF